jgi:hypothetical protein
MSFYTCFDWFKKLRLFVNERNVKIDVVLKASIHILYRFFLIQIQHSFFMFQFPDLQSKDI